MEEPVYVAVSPVCGGWVMVATDDPRDNPDDRAEMFRDISKAAAQGYEIRHIAFEDFRSILPCDCPRNKKGRKVHQAPGQPETGQLALIGAG